MSTVIFDISMSLDGFITAASPTLAQPMGRGGESLHGWAYGEDPVNRDYLSDAIGHLGAVVCGRRTYDTSIGGWGPNGPSGPARLPVFVVTHQPPRTSPGDGVYTFVNDGIGSALRQAEGAAGSKEVTVMGGADLGRQCLAAGLLDEISIHLVPVLMGTGTRMFEGLELGEHQVRLETTHTLDTPAATHLRYRIVTQPRTAAAQTAPHEGT